MSTKEELRGKVRQIQETGQMVLRWPSLVRWAEYLIRLLLGALLAGAEIFGGYAPFGLGMVAASGAGPEGFSALLGSCAGYLAFRGFVDGLPYVAAGILTFAVAFAFYDVKLFRQGWFMPVVGALLGGVTGFVYLSDELTGVAQWVFFATELLLIGASAYFYRHALSPWQRRREDAELTERQTVSLFILGCTLLIALAEARVLGLSLGCLAGALCTILLAWRGGVGVGAPAGVCTGLAMDLALGQAPRYTMAYAFAGLLTGVFWKQGKLAAALTYVLANGIMVLWGWEDGPQLSILYEVFVASVVFMVLPDSLTRRLSAILERGHKEETDGSDERLWNYARRKLEYTADAFRELYDGLRASFRRVAVNEADGSGVFHRAANQVCVLCALRDHCWQREYPATMNAINDGLPAMLKRGRGEPEDFPLHFRTRCLNFPALLATANEELTALRYRRQFQARARESREAVCRQYGLFTSCLDEVVRRMGEQQVRDARREKRLRQRLTALGVAGDACVWFDRSGHLVLEVFGESLEGLKSDEERKHLSRLMGMALSGPEACEDCLRWRQAEPLMAVAGVSARKKEGQTVSGDAGAWFKTEEGGLFVLLCDGMGSGPEAHRESTLAIRLLEKFLRAGMEPEEALNTLNSALALRCEEEGGFTTIDLFRLDLYTGEAGFYKLGAAPTYVRRRGTVSRVTGAALPAGLNGGSGGPDVSKMRLEAGDSVVLISDGVASAKEDGWVKEALAQYGGEDPKSLAAQLIEGSAAHEGTTDDRTAVVLTVKEREG